MATSTPPASPLAFQATTTPGPSLALSGPAATPTASLSLSVRPLTDTYCSEITLTLPPATTPATTSGTVRGIQASVNGVGSTRGGGWDVHPLNPAPDGSITFVFTPYNTILLTPPPPASKPSRGLPPDTTPLTFTLTNIPTHTIPPTATITTHTTPPPATDTTHTETHTTTIPITTTPPGSNTPTTR
ncbi:hypothetical protein [Streptomyces sp. NPDC001719]